MAQVTRFFLFTVNQHNGPRAEKTGDFQLSILYTSLAAACDAGKLTSPSKDTGNPVRHRCFR